MFFMGRMLVPDFHTCCLYHKSSERIKTSLARCARSISHTSPTRAKIPYAPWAWSNLYLNIIITGSSNESCKKYCVNSTQQHFRFPHLCFGQGWRRAEEGCKNLCAWSRRWPKGSKLWGSGTRGPAVVSSVLRCYLSCSLVLSPINQ